MVLTLVRRHFEKLTRVGVVVLPVTRTQKDRAFGARSTRYPVSPGLSQPGEWATG